MASVLVRLHKSKDTSFKNPNRYIYLDKVVYNLTTDVDIDFNLNLIISIVKTEIEQNTQITLVQLLVVHPALFKLIALLCCQEDHTILHYLSSNAKLYYNYVQLKGFLLEWRNTLISSNINNEYTSSQDLELEYWINVIDNYLIEAESLLLPNSL